MTYDYCVLYGSFVMPDMQDGGSLLWASCLDGFCGLFQHDSGL